MCFTGSSNAFHHVYEGAILASRQPSATPAEKALGETRASELNRVTSMFILRRTQEINTKYLPPKGMLRCIHYPEFQKWGSVGPCYLKNGAHITQIGFDDMC